MADGGTTTTTTTTLDSRCNRRARLTTIDLPELVDRARDGEDDAWTELVRRFQRLVHGRIRALGLSATMADDAAQATWIRLATSLDRIEDPRRLGGWLRVTAHNEAVNLIRREWRWIPDGELPELADETTDPLDGLVRDDTTEAVQAAVGVLNERQRAIIELRYFQPEAVSYAAIADQLDIDQGSIGPTLGRSLQRMRRHPTIVQLQP